MRKWKVFLLVLSTVLMLGACGAEGGTETGEADPQTAGTVDESSWESAFAKAGFTDAEIDRYREVLETVGVTDYHDVTVVDNDPMTIVVGEIYDSSNLQVNVTLEDHEIIYIGLTGIPTRQAEPYFNWRGELKTKTVNTTMEVVLYSDTEGGYLAVLDWDGKQVSEYEP